MTIFTNGTFSTKLNQVDHEIELYLDRSAGESDSDIYKYPINPNSIVNLQIEDTLADWVVRGTLTFLYYPENSTNKDNQILKQTGQIAGVSNINMPDFKPFYSFRNDGLDLLRIRIKPKINSSGGGTVSPLIITNNTHWTLSYLFSIYEAEDIDLPPGALNAASASVKCLKLYFWDSWYQQMITNVMQYSTGLSSQAEPDANGLGVLPTGNAMKEIIELGLSENNSQQNYTPGIAVSNPALKFNYQPTGTDKEWDSGAAKIFYTAPADATVYDSLMYVYKRHISNETLSFAPAVSPPRGGAVGTSINDFSILLKERGPTETDVGYLALKPVSYFFQNAGKEASTPGQYQIEHFFLQSYSDTNSTPKTFKAPISETKSDTVDLKTPKYSIITNYRFVDIAAATNSTMYINTPVHSFDFKQRMYNVEFTNNSVKAAQNFIEQKYIKQLYKSNSSALDKLSLIQNYKDKVSKNTKPVFSLYGEDPIIRQHAGLHRLLYIGLFHNTAINFRTLGLTSREAGRFIAIDKTQGSDNGDFDDKFFGQWFIINIKHIIESEMYYNDITAVKIHRFQELTF
jgi:hypothetical protein